MEKKEGNVNFVKWFSELSNSDVPIAGGKGASLAEMSNNKFPIPPGFVVTAQAYRHFIEKTGLRDKINDLLKDLDVNETDSLNEASKKIRELINKGDMPKELESDILEAYEILDVDKKKLANAKEGALDILRTGHEPPFVAVRSSATAEDLADASFAGQQESFLNVKGERELLKKVKQCFSSLFTARAIYYREKKGFEHDKTYLAVVVQRMVDSDKSGVIFSRNPVRNDGSILIEAVFGLGEGIVSGSIKPDNYVVEPDVENLKIKSEEVNEKKIAIVRDSSGKNESVKLTIEKSKQRVLTNYEIKRLAQYAKKLEEHYGKPQDIEFAIEGEEIYIVQSRPITTKFEDSAEEEIGGKELLSGLGASPGVGSGAVKIVNDLSQLEKIKNGDVLVTKMTNPDMVVSMQRAAAIVTDEGGLTSHAAIVSREMGIPAVVGTGEATSKLKDGQVITVDGRRGKVYEGRSEAKAAEIKQIVPTKTKIKVIVDLPDYALRAAKSGAKSIGLVRLEGIIASSGKHPLKYVKEDKMEDYVAVLSRGLRKITEPFEEIWIRSSDIRSDEYGNLEGAPKGAESNPMMGDHGIRFSLRHPKILKAEFTAVKEVADEFPKKKIGLMMPLVISVAELKEAKRIAKEEVGIPDNVKIGVMVETPAAVQIINKLCEEGLDFISFGTNDLTQFTLAIDRNNGDVQYLYDEMNPAVLNSMRYVIKRCKHYGVETSICGQAGSRVEMARFLVGEGIDSVSVNADAAYKVSEVIADVEKNFSVVRDKEGRVEEESEEDGKSSSADAKVLEDFKKTKQEVREVPMAKMAGKEMISDQDMEALVLKELEGTLDGEDDSGKEEIPLLNDAIPIESADLEEKKEEEIELEGEEAEDEVEGLLEEVEEPPEAEELAAGFEEGKGDSELGEEWEKGGKDERLDIF